MATGFAAEDYLAVRRRTEALCAPLAVEDHVPQPCVDVSPPKWHLGHTTWFFETLVLQAFEPGHRPHDARWGALFNSYYESLGPRTARPERGHLSRPTVDEILRWRVAVDEAMVAWLQRPGRTPEMQARVALGLQHEQQHQELLVSDIKAILGLNPLRPAYDPEGRGTLNLAAEHRAIGLAADAWVTLPEAVVEVGHAGPGFAFDNEAPRHRVLVGPVALRRGLVTQREYLAFMRDGGYARFDLWHAEGWDWLREEAVQAPLYWQADPESPSGWRHYTLSGSRPLDLDAPVTHVSFYEAAAFCRWAGWRLPTEFEWEAAAGQLDWGTRWEWTGSAYLPYPGFRPAAGAVGEYNGKFMVNQMVLRGASYATPPGHARVSYRNFFHAPLRWPYTGIRPARDHPGRTTA